KRKHHSAAQWQTWLNEFAVSDLSQSEFCRQRGLTLSAFYNWRKKLEPNLASTRASTPESFIEIKPSTAHQASVPSISSGVADWDLELELGHGRVLRLRVS